MHIHTGLSNVQLRACAILCIPMCVCVCMCVLQETIVGALKFGAFVGTFIGGALMLRYGRRPAIAATSVTGVLGPVIMAASEGPV